MLVSGLLLGAALALVGPVGEGRADGAAAPTFVASSSPVVASGYLVGSIALTKPAGIQAGDVLIAQVTQSGVNGLAPPAGWTTVTAHISGVYELALYVKVAGASEPANYTFSGTPISNTFLIGAISAYRGVDQANPVNAASIRYTPYADNLTSASSLAIPTTAENSMIHSGVWFANSGSGTSTPPTGATQDYHAYYTPGASHLAAAHDVKASAGLTQRAFGLPNSSHQALVAIVALTPAGGAHIAYPNPLRTGATSDRTTGALTLALQSDVSVQPGDVLVAIIHSGYNLTVAPPTGWVLLDQAGKTFTFVRSAGRAEPENGRYQFTSSGGSTDYLSGVMSTYTNARLPLDGHVLTAPAGSTATPTADPITPRGPNRIVVSWVRATAPITAPPSGMTSGPTVSNGGDTTRLSLADVVKSVPASVAPSWTLSSAVSGSRVGTILLSPADTLPPEQSYGTCDGSGTHALAPSECIADPVNTLTGAFTTSATDVDQAATGVAFAFTRSYTSADPTSGRLGPGWTDNYAVSLAVQPNGDVLVHGDEGQLILYTKQSDGSYLAAAGGLSALTAITGGYKLVRHDQVTYQFNTSGVLQSELDRNGQGLTFVYDGSGRLTTITDAAAHSTTLSYNADNLLSSLSSADGRTVSYGYTSARLTSVTLPDPDGAGPKTAPVWTYTYDGGGRLATEVDPNNHTMVTNVYDPSSGRVTQQTDARGKTTGFAWDAATETATITDPNNHTWKDVYANGVLIKRIDGTGQATLFGHDAGFNTTTVTAPSSASTAMTYDSRGNLLTATAPASLDNAQKTLSYDAKNNLTSVTDARSNVTTYGYDTAGNNTSVTQDGQTVGTNAYDAQGRVTSSTDGRNNTTTYTYDTNGNLASVTDPLGNKTTYGYDSAGRMTSKVEPLGNVAGADPDDYRRTYTYDATGKLLAETDPLGHTTSYTYDAAGNTLTETDPNSHTTTYAYNAADQLTSTTAPDAGVTSYTYDDAGNKATETDARGKTTTYGYDAANRLASVTTPLGNKTTYFYDQNGNQSKTIEPRGNLAGANPDDYATTYTYNIAGRPLAETDALGHTTSYTYDKVGNRTAVTDANNHTTSYAYDGRGRLTSVTAPDGGVTAFSYDANGNVLTRTDANNHVTSYSYDAANRLISKTLPPNRTWSYSHDANGRLATTIDANGNTTQPAGDGTTIRSYDRSGRLTAIDYSDNTPDVSYSYDAVGNRASISDGAGTQTYSYDNANRLTGLTRGADIFAYSYDAAGNPASRTYPGSPVVTYGYDNDERLVNVSSGGNSTSYAYDAAGRLTSTSLPTSNGYVETRSYDRAGRLTQVLNANGASVLSDFISALDPVGNPTRVTRTGALDETATYGYDVNDRLTSVCYQTSCPNSNDPYIRWTYDQVGSRLSEARPTGTTNYIYNAADEMTAAGPTSYTYDMNGNEISAGVSTYSYDLANRLAATTTGSSTTSYTYDGDGNRNTATGGGTTSNYLWDINQPLPQLALERTGSGALLRRYLYGRRRIAMAASTDFYYHYDTLGSVTNLTSDAGGAEWTYSYEPFGAARTETQNDLNAPANEMHFEGEESDSTGLYYLRARQYDPSAGRFTRIDPADQTVRGAAISGYTYAGDRPTVMADPSGTTFSPTDAATLACTTASSPNATPFAVAGLNPAPPPGVPSCKKATLRGSGGWLRFWMSRRGHVYWEASMWNVLLDPGFWEVSVYWDTLYIATSLTFNAPRNQQIRAPLPGTIISISGYHDDILGTRHPVQGSCFVPF